MVRRRPASAPSNCASAKPRRSERIEKQQVAAKSESSTTTQESAPSPSKRKRGNAQLKTTKASARNKPVVKEKPAKKKTAKNAATRSKQNQKYQSLKSRDNAAEELPHNLGSVPSSIPAETGAALEPTDSDKENRALSDENVSSVAADLQATIDTAAPKKRKTNRPAYRLTPGITPYPDLPHPTAEECEEVNRLLSEVHGEVIPPATIPEPSLTITGCGEVPSVLDALIRTLLSGATSGNNSALAFDGLVRRFGILKEGIGKGSVNWDAVRQAPLEDVFEAIKRGGLAAIKSKSLKAILDKVYEVNQAQSDRLKANDESNDDKDLSASSQRAEQTKEYEIACAEQHVLSLNHLHALSTEEVMTELVKYPGIGPKTAACVILFCLQRPCFAVDTHIFRICKWLGWVPSNATEITAFSHLEVRIPGHLKYSLHQLFIRHGKSCPRCRAITGEKSAGWGEGCIIEHLVQRTGVRKGGAAVPSKGKQPTRSRKRKRGTAAKKKQTKAKGSPKKVTPATRKSTRSTRKTTAKEESTSTTTDATDGSSPSPAAVDKDASSSDAVSLILPSHAPVSDETSTHTTPTPEKDNAIESARFESAEHKISSVSAIEEDASTRKASPELEATKTLERENIPSHEIKKDTSDEKGEIAKDPEDAE